MKNTNERIIAKNDFGKDFYKLMNNSVYGKTMENIRNRISFILISSEEKALSMKNDYKMFTTFNNNLIGVHLCKREVTLNKPIFIGHTVLDQSKYLMYDFHYNFILQKFKEKMLIYYSLILVVYAIILKMKIHLKLLKIIKTYLIYQNIQKIMNYMIQQIKK